MVWVGNVTGFWRLVAVEYGPEVVGVADDVLAVTECDLVAGPADLNLGREPHATWPALLVEQFIADLHLPHGGPALGVGSGVSMARALPLPRGIAIANRPPSNTATSILAMTLRWSDDQGRWNVAGK